MSFIRPGVHCNALCAKFFTLSGRQGDIRDIASAGIADSGNFVDIYAESCHILY